MHTGKMTSDNWMKLDGKVAPEQFALFRTRLVGWCLEKSRRYRQALLRTGRYKDFKYSPDIDASSSSAADSEEKSGVEETSDAGKTSKKTGSKPLMGEQKMHQIKQMKYNRICERIWGKILSKLGEEPTTKLLNRQPAVIEGDGPTAYEYLQAIYHGTEVRSLSSLFISLISTINMDFCDGYDAYLNSFRLTVRSIDLNPGMAKYTKIVGEQNSLPQQLLVALFLRGLSEEFQDTKRAINDDIAQGRTVDLSEVYRRCTSLHLALEQSAHEANLVERKHSVSKDSKPRTLRKQISDPRQTEILCRNFQKYGSCRYGTKCKFVHRGGTEGRGGDEFRGKRTGNHANLVQDVSTVHEGETFVHPSLLSDAEKVVTQEGKTSKGNGKAIAAKSFYAIYNGKGGYTGVVEDWKDCRPKVKHADGVVRAGVSWRKFGSLKEAEGFLYQRAAEGGTGESNHVVGFSLEGSYAITDHKGLLLKSTKGNHSMIATASILDSGTNIHMTGDVSRVSNPQRIYETVKVADNQHARLTHEGRQGTLNEVKVLPGGANLISIGRICDEVPVPNPKDPGEPGVLFLRDRVYHGNFEPPPQARRIGVRGMGTNGLYHSLPSAFREDAGHMHAACLSDQVPDDPIRLLHERYGHISLQKLADAVQSGDIPSSLSPEAIRSYRNSSCLGCGLSKCFRRKFNKHSHLRSLPSRPLQRICIDTCIVSTPSSRGHRAFLVIVDEYTRFAWIRTLRRRSESAHEFRKFVKELRDSGITEKLELVRSDNAKEFLSRSFKQTLISFGAVGETTAPYQSTGQNPIAERFIRTIVEMTRATMQHNRVPIAHWDLCLNEMLIIYRHIPHPSTVKKTSPFRALYSDRPTSAMRHLRRFYCPVFARIPTHPRGHKFSPIAELGRYVGVDDVSKGYKVLLPSGKIIRRRDVYFIEDPATASMLSDPLHRSPARIHFSDTWDEGGEVSSDDDEASDSKTSHKQRQLKTSRYPCRARTPRVPHNVGGSQEEILQSFGLSAESKKHDDYFTPKSYRDAMSCEDRKEWADSIEREYQNFRDHDVFDVVKIPHNCENLVDYLLVFKNKKNADGTLKKRKTRLTARGDTQRYKIDFDQTYAPTVRASALKLFFALCCRWRLRVFQFDVQAAFLQSTLDCVMYMRAPPGMGVPKTHCLKLKKAVYGTRQASRCFNLQFSKFLCSLGFEQSSIDRCIFIRRHGSTMDMLAMHVDDGLLAVSSTELQNEIMSAIQQRWKIGELEPLNYYLGFEFTQNAECSEIRMSARSYIEDLLRRFRMEDASPHHTPMVEGMRLPVKVSDDLAIDTAKYPYAQLVGSLLFASNFCRIDITYATNTLSRAMAKPSMMHWKAAKRVLAYLGAYKDMCLRFHFDGQPDAPCKVVTTSDADFAGDASRHSVYGYISHLDGSPLYWQCKLDKTKVALSSMESELKGIVEACKDNMFHVHLLRELHIPCNTKYHVRSDNQPALKLCRNPEYHGRAKHIDISQHFVRHLYDEGKVELEYVPSEENVADILTKPLGRIVFERLRSRLMVSGLRGAIKPNST